MLQTRLLKINTIQKLKDTLLVQLFKLKNRLWQVQITPLKFNTLTKMEITSIIM